jgi:hypothetical protein
MTVQSLESPHLASLHALGMALASDPRDVLVGFIEPVTRMGRPVWLRDRHFPGAIVYAMTRSHGAITHVTYRLHPGSGTESLATVRPDGDWQIPACELADGETRLLVTAHTADGQLAQAAVILVVPPTE